MTYEIESDVPIPAESRTGSRKSGRYPFREMKPGDSFVAESDAYGVDSCRAYAAALMFGRRHGAKFIGKKVDDRHVRIWRVK